MRIIVTDVRGRVIERDATPDEVENLRILGAGDPVQAEPEADEEPDEPAPKPRARSRRG